jgi:hypothetical protein
MPEDKPDLGSSALTLQINSKAALERLLGSDTTLEVSLRHAVAAAFARQHLENIALATLKQEEAQMREKVKAMVNEALTVEERDALSWTRTLKLTPEGKALVKAELEARVAEYVRDQASAVNKQITDQILAHAKTIPALVEQKFKRTFDEAVEAGVKARLIEIRKLLPTEEETRKINVP